MIPEELIKEGQLAAKMGYVWITCKKCGTRQKVSVIQGVNLEVVA